MALVTVTGTLLDEHSNPLGQAAVQAMLSWGTTIATGELAVVPVTAQTASDGTWSMQLPANSDISQPANSYYTVVFSGNFPTYNVAIVVPTGGPYEISTIIVAQPAIHAQYISIAAVETARALAAEALLAPKASPTFTGVVTTAHNTLDDGTGKASILSDLFVAGAFIGSTAVIIEPASTGQIYLRTTSGSNAGMLFGNSGEWVTFDNSGAVRNTLDDGTGKMTSTGIFNLGNGVMAAAGNISLYAGNGAEPAMKVVHVVSAVNYLQTVDSVTTSPTLLQAAGEDTNISISILPKGTGNVLLGGQSGNGAQVTNFGTVLSGSNYFGGVAGVTTILFATGNIVAQDTAGVYLNILNDGSGNMTITGGTLTFSASTQYIKVNGGYSLVLNSGGVATMESGGAPRNVLDNGAGAMSVTAGLGVFGHAAPGSQPAAPVTLTDVIAIIRGCGLSA